MNRVVIDGNRIRSELELHRALARELELGDHYGANLAALRDRLLADVPRPLRLVWKSSDESRVALGDQLFGRIVAVFQEATEQDIAFGWEERFEFELG